MYTHRDRGRRLEGKHEKRGREAKKRETRTILVLAVVIIIVASGVAGVRVRVGI